MANTGQTATAKTTRARIADHEWLDKDGAVVDAEEAAYGYRYTLKDVAESFEWNFDKASEDARRMLALFGAKTLATNESSGVRNSDKYNGDPNSQMDSVKSRFATIESGQWTEEREGGGVAVRIDKDALAQAICLVLVAEGKKTQADIDSGHKAKVRQKLEDDPQYVRKTRQVPQVATEYAKIVGRPTATVDDLDV